MSVLLLLLACAEEEVVPLHFDGPVAGAALAAEDGPFEEVTAYVANSRSGTIVPLDPKEGRLLTDDPMASFLRSAAVPTGQARLLADVVVVGDGATVTLWAADHAFTQLLRVPYVVSVDEDGHPVEAAPTAGDVAFVDADGSGDSVAVSDLKLRAGFTTTEDWSIEYDGERWWAKGSRSGTQVSQPVAGVPYRSDDGEIELLLDGTATVGDRVEFRTETGIDEIDLGGPVTGLWAGGGRVYASVASDTPRVVVYDGVGGGLVSEVALPAGAQPTRISGAPDGRVFVADGVNPVAWVLRFDQEAAGVVPVESIAVAAPLVDLAWQGGEDEVGTPFDHLFVAPLGALRVDVWDLAAGAWVDPNPVTPEAEGVWLGSPVTGLGASAGSVWLQQQDDWGARARMPTVVVATGEGFVYQLEGPTGCAVADARGPHVPNPTYDGADAVALDDQGEPSDPFLVESTPTGAQVVAAACGGVARSETWTVTYDSALLSWEVEGSLSGVQAARAYDDQRYLSDDGAVSFLIASGAFPATDGDRFEFTVDGSLLVFSGSDDDEDGAVDTAWEFPGRPVTLGYTSGPTGGGWDEVDRREFALVPVVNGDIVARLHLDSGKTDVRWQ